MTGGSSMMRYPYLFFLRIWFADVNHQAFTKDLEPLWCEWWSCNMGDLKKVHCAWYSSLNFLRLIDFTFNCLYRTPCYALFSHHPHQTPSLGPFISNPVRPQTQVCQHRVRFEAFGQGLRVQLLNWSNSGSSQSSLPSWEFVRLLNRGFLYEINFFMFLLFSHLSHQVWPKLIDQKQPSRDIRTYQIDVQSHPSQSDHHKTTSEESKSPRIYTHLHMSLKYARSIDLRAHNQNFLSHWAAALI